VETLGHQIEELLIANEPAKMNKVVNKQITDDEKSTIATLNTQYSTIALNAGQYTFTNLVKLLAKA
jgi:hypothetical protein